MSDIFKYGFNLISLTTNTFGISCEKNADVLNIEINLNTIISLAVFSCTVLVVIFCHNFIKERFSRLKSSTISLNCPPEKI
ncbi:MAG: hypothetical protein C4539_15970 [Ignavibacteriales bacterium]|nr:MAG: hypothetical protein C4539_15970 [Ignavibacteriales bacterium]